MLNEFKYKEKGELSLSPGLWELWPWEWIVQIMTGPHYTLTVTFATADASPCV